MTSHAVWPATVFVCRVSRTKQKVFAIYTHIFSCVWVDGCCTLIRVTIFNVCPWDVFNGTVFRLFIILLPFLAISPAKIQCNIFINTILQINVVLNRTPVWCGMVFDSPWLLVHFIWHIGNFLFDWEFISIGLVPNSSVMNANKMGSDTVMRLCVDSITSDVNIEGGVAFQRWSILVLHVCTNRWVPLIYRFTLNLK